MNKIAEELKKCKVFYIATIDGDTPRVRPFSSVTDYNGKVYICTNNTKNVWKQIEKNPNVEICGMKGGNWIRVSGKLVNDDSIEAKKAVLDDPTGPSNIYKLDSPVFKVMYLENPKCIKYSMTSEPVEISER